MNSALPGIVFDGKAAKLFAGLADPVLGIDDEAGQAEGFSGIALQGDGFFYFVEFAQLGDAIMGDLEFEMIQRVTAHEHPGHFFFVVQQFGQRPGFTVGDLWAWRYPAWPGRQTGYCCLGRIGLIDISEFDDLLQTGGGIAGRRYENIVRGAIRETIEGAGISKAFQCLFIDGSLVDTFDQVEDRGKSAGLVSVLR